VESKKERGKKKKERGNEKSVGKMKMKKTNKKDFFLPSAFHFPRKNVHERRSVTPSFQAHSSCGIFGNPLRVFESPPCFLFLFFSLFSENTHKTT